MFKWQSGISVSILCLATSVGVWAQEPMPPKPGPEYQALGYFEGKWSFEGESQASPMGPAGKISSTDSCEWFDGGFALVCRSEGTAPMGPSKALGIMSYDSEKKLYTYYGVETGMPPFTATGQRDGKVWHYTSESMMGGKSMKTRVTITETSATTYTFEMEASIDGGPWTAITEGKATKKTT